MSYEITTPEAVGPAVQAHGFALWRGMVDAKTVAALLAVARETAQYKRHNGALKFKNKDVLKVAFAPQIDAVFHTTLGPYVLVGGKWETCFLFADHGLKPTVWHQEAETVPDGCLMCWVALEDCGTDAPGLSFLGTNLGETHPVLMPDDASGMLAKEYTVAHMDAPVVTPEFRAGDAVFFDRYTVHRTHITPDMTRPRVAYKMTGMRHGG